MAAQFQVDTDRIASAAGDIARISAEIEGQVGRGEGLGALEVTVTPPEAVDPTEAAAYEELGVDRLNLMLPWSADDDGIARFFDEIVSPLVHAQAPQG